MKFYKKKISIILPTFNNAKLISRAITSVINQSYKNWELIIIDNFSIDNTQNVVESFNDKKIKYFKLKNNGIIAISRNYGIKKSSGEFIAFLDSDDYWLNNKLSISVETLTNKFDLVYHDFFFHKIHQPIIMIPSYKPEIYPCLF